MFSLQSSLSSPSYHPTSGGSSASIMNRYPSNRNANHQALMQRRRANSTSNCVIEKKRGFRPSDRFDPVKRQFLLELGRKFWLRTVRKLSHNEN